MPTTLGDVPEHLVVDFDIHDHSIADLVHTKLAEIRAHAPVTWSEAQGGYWIVSRYEDVHAVLRDPETFSSWPNAIPTDPNRPDPLIPLEIDPPEHAEYRRLLGPLFSPGRAKAHEAAILELTTRLIDGFASRGTAELIAEFAHPLPSGLFLALMGWPAEDEGSFAAWTEAILSGAPGASQEEDARIRREATEAVFPYFMQVIADRRAHPTDDFTSILVHAQYSGERPLSDNELVYTLFLLMLGGLHTVRGVLGFAIIALAERPEVRDKVVADLSLVPDLVEEMLRLEAPVAAGRTVTREVELGGVVMQPGDRVLAEQPSANRDAAEFEDPDELRLDRGGNRHLTFSVGPHRCIGSHLARVELRIALTELLRRLPDFRITQPPVLHSGQVRGVSELHVAFTPEQPR